ncbi:hypothetical protein RFI_00869 [Reticulomyxa filosa]|uniref:Uncharacterized protein n=1 Tax=Reticulomyxa filosa TaxID=46433 RepID=X6PET3_RETFI|nr:hypothetical protein RFI_00869 [Reticulomyxa filosa]|eukprot:ETO36192.1 hypothetical protein RFI_00869 [Reticulomyxa filosa]
MHHIQTPEQEDIPKDEIDIQSKYAKLGLEYPINGITTNIGSCIEFVINALFKKWDYDIYKVPIMDCQKILRLFNEDNVPEIYFLVMIKWILIICRLITGKVGLNDYLYNIRSDSPYCIWREEEIVCGIKNYVAMSKNRFQILMYCPYRNISLLETEHGLESKLSSVQVRNRYQEKDLNNFQVFILNLNLTVFLLIIFALTFWSL